MNSLGSEVSAEFEKILGEIETNASVQSAVIISAKPGCFVAGADISMLEKCKSAQEATTISHGAQILFDRLERSRKPVVAAISGVCLGGGLELALACHYRIATKDKKVCDIVLLEIIIILHIYLFQMLIVYRPAWDCQR